MIKKRCIYVLTLCDDYVLTYLHMQEVKPPSPAERNGAAAQLSQVQG